MMSRCKGGIFPAQEEPNANNKPDKRQQIKNGILSDASSIVLEAMQEAWQSLANPIDDSEIEKEGYHQGWPADKEEICPQAKESGVENCKEGVDTIGRIATLR